MSKIVNQCRELLNAYKNGELGQTIMPEDSNPRFSQEEKEIRYSYFSLPMALNYQRNSYDLWKSALKTYQDVETRKVFDIRFVSKIRADELRNYLSKYKLALQPNKHISTWKRISETVFNNWGSFSKLFEESEYDFLVLRKMIQSTHKKLFPYISGPKIFNYWSYILDRYCDLSLKNSEYIDIAPDTHVTKCSILLGVITQNESKLLSKEQLSKRWRDILKDTTINPIDMHAPLWFWSKNGFVYHLKGE